MTTAAQHMHLSPAQVSAALARASTLIADWALADGSPVQAHSASSSSGGSTSYAGPVSKPQVA